MRTVVDAQVEMLAGSSGDMRRDLSEHGLAFQEVWAASEGALAHVGERNPDGVAPSDVPMLLQVMFIYGVLTGVRFERG